MSVSANSIVIGVDSSTQSTKAIAWDRTGRAVGSGSAPIAMSNPGHDRFEQDPADWWRSFCVAVQECLRQIDGRTVEALSIVHQRETVAFLDHRGAAIHPAILWLDERSRDNVVSLGKSVGVETIHRITGRHPDLTPTVYKLDWMRRNEPDVFARTAYFVDVQGYLAQRLVGGPFRTSATSADSFGIFDMEQRCWSPLLLEAVGLSSDRLPATVPPGTLLGSVTATAAIDTGLPEGLPIFAGGGDGAYAGLGTDCTRTDRAYVNLGTAVVSGVWSPEYRYGRGWRTLLAAQGEGYVFENVLRSGAFLVNWFVDNFIPQGRTDPRVFEHLEAAAQKVPIGCHGLLIQPYFSGVMDPYWDVNARGVTFGQSGSHKPAHFYRALLEGITLDQVMRTRGTEAASGYPIDHYVANGGGSGSPLWRQMLADASGKPVLISDTVEASALGAGMNAAYGAGWFSSITEAARGMVGRTKTVSPDPQAGERYGALLDIYQDAYGACSKINQRLVSFARMHEASRCDGVKD